MNIPFEQLPSDAKVWVYASNRKLTKPEQQEIIAKGEAFVESWTAHQQQLKAAFALLLDVFIVIGVDENVNEVSGCGIDKSIHFIKTVESAFNISLFDRLQIELLINNEIILTNKQKLAVMLQQGTVNEQTTLFNKTITTKHQYDSQFQLTLGKSWVYPLLLTKQTT